MDPPEVLFGFNGEERFAGFVFSAKVFMLKDANQQWEEEEEGVLMWFGGMETKRKEATNRGGEQRGKWMERKWNNKKDSFVV